MEVEITQFMRPNGKQVSGKIEISDDCQEQYDAIIAAGGRLTCEQLMSGVVSQTIEFTDGDVDMILTNPSKESKYREDLEKMIRRYTPEALASLRDANK